VINKNYQIITFGSATVDIFLKSANFRLLSSLDSRGRKTSLCTIYGEKVEIADRFLASGGGGTNSAAAFSRLGLKTAVVARLGDDCFGELVISELAQQKKLDRKLLVIKHEETDQSLILLSPEGKRTILVYRGATRLQESVIPWRKIKASNFYITSLEGNIELAARLIGRAQQSGGRVFWNPGQMELRRREKVLALAAKTHLFLNQAEAEDLFMAVGADLERKIRRRKIPLLAITQGAGGATVFWQAKKLYQPALAVSVKDTTGAGDAFGAGVAAALIYGKPLDLALSWGLANSASVVSRLGAKRGLLSARQLTKFLQRHGRR